MPRIGNLVISGSLIISSSNGSTTVLGSGSKNEYNGDMIIKSGSLFVIGGGLSAQSSSLSSSWTATSGGTQTSGSAGITGSSDVTGSSTVIGDSTVTGSFTTVGTSTTSGSTATFGSSATSGSLTTIGDSLVMGDINLHGCLTINCCEDVLYEGYECKVVDLFDGGFIAQVANAYGSNTTDTLTDAIAVGSGSLYFYSPSGNELLTFPIDGINFTDTPDTWNYTYITASGDTFGTSISLGSIVIVGQSGSILEPPLGGFKYPLIPVEDCHPIVEFCCSGAMIDVDVSISGGLGVTGSVDITGSLGVTGSVDITGSVTVSGCVEVITSASCDRVLFTGFNASFRSSFFSGSVWLTSLYVTTPPYGDITAEFESYANNNGGIVTLYNTETSEIIYVNFLESYYNGFANVLQLTGNQEVIPDSTGYLAIGIDGTSPIGADVIITVPGECFSTVIICDEEIIINGDTSVSGSVSVTGSVTVTPDPCPEIIGFDIFIKSSQEFDPGIFTSQIILGPQYGNINSILNASLSANGNKLRVVNSDLSFNKLCTFVSYNPVGVGSIMVETTTAIPILQSYILADAGYVSLPLPADAVYVNLEACPQDPSIAVINSDVVEINVDATLSKSLILGGNNTAFDTTTGIREDFQYIGYEGIVGLSGKGYSVYLDSRYGDIRLFVTDVLRFKFYSSTNNEIYEDTYYAIDFIDGQSIITPEHLNFTSFDGESMVVGISEKVFVGADITVMTQNFDQTIVVGNNNYSEHKGSLLAGKGLVSSIDYGTVLGIYNSPSTSSLLIVGNGDGRTSSNAFEVTNIGSIIIPTTSSAAPSYSGSQGEMFFGDDGAGNYVIWAYLGGAWRSGSLA